MKRMIGAFICVFAMLFIITCTDLTNPFLNRADAKAEIIKKNSANSDTVDIFSTQNLLVNVLLKEHVESIKVHVDNNRLWKSFDTLVSRPYISPSLNIPFSFYTTGRQNIRLITYIDNGDSVVDTCSMYARSPLKQDAINASIGDSVLISTDPVADKIIYVWDFHNGIVVKELTASTLIKVTSPFTSHSGELYVEDFANHRSPSVIFQLSNKPVTPDTSSKLVIFCTNDSIKADSVYSQKAELKFSIEVSGAQRLTSARVNGMSFNDSLRMGELYVLNYYLSSLDTIHAPVALTISVTDNLERTVTKTFFVHYIKIDPVINVVYPVGDSMPTAATTVNVLGNISKNQQYDSLYVFARNNGKVQGMVCITQKKPVFSFEIPLTSSSNHIALELYSDSLMVGSQLSVSQFYVFYNPAHIDTLPPQIRNIRCNGGLVDSFFMSRTSVMKLEIDAVDNSNKLTVDVNGEKIDKGIDELFFTKNVVLTHKKDSTLIAVKATDSSGYSVNDSIYVGYNRLPRWIKTPSYSVITAGEESEFLIEAADPDNDSLFVTMNIKRQSGDLLLDASSGHVVWHPQVADTGAHRVELTAWDGYEPIDTVFTIVVKSNGLSAVPVKLSENIDFPDTLFMGDSLHVVLHEVPLTGSKPFSYAAYFVDERSKIILNGPDSALLWVPAVTDTGMRTLRVVIKDSLNYKDSMDVKIRVMKRILAHLKWKQNSSQFPEGGLENNSPTIILSPALNSIVTIPYTITFPGGDKAAIASDIKSPVSGTVSFNGKDDSLASILLSIVDDSIPEGTEKFEIRLSDNDSIKLCDSCNNVFYGEIIDNDLVTFYFEETEAEGLEKIGTVTATVRLSRPFQTGLELSYEVDTVKSTAKIGTDFNFIGPVQKLIFDPGRMQARINLNIVDDKVREENETIILKLRSENEFAKPRDSVNFIYTIMNDDSAVHYSFTAAETSGSEGDSVITIKVNLDKKVDVPVVVKFSVDSDPSKTTATKDIDFRILDADSIIFNAGDTSKLIRIAIEDDTFPELNDEFFTLKLQSENAITSPGHFTSCKYTILKNEVGVFFASPSQTADEEYNRRPYCEIMLTGPLKDSLIVHVVIDTRSTATSGSDFTIREPEFIVFRPGETRKDLGITITDDEKAEQTEHLYLKITEVSDLKRAYIRTDNTTNISIQNN